MAVVNYTVERITTEKDPCHVLTWSGLTTGDTGQPVEMPGSADRTVQVGGTFGGGTCIIEGSNNGTDYLVLTDPQGNALSITSAKIETITEITRYMRPRISGGSGVSINVSMLVRRDL
jgi:hypothetical protein